MRSISYILFTALFLTGTSCSGGKREFSSKEEMQAYVNDHDNGFITTINAGDHVFSAKVNPVMEGDDAFTIQLRISREDGLSVLKHHELSPQEITDKELYLSFDVMNDAYLVADGREVLPILHHYEHNYKLKPSIDLSFSFPVIHPESPVKFVFRDEVFGTGLQELEFESETFEPFNIQQ